MNCGALCLVHVHESHGQKLSLTRARKIAKTGRHGTHVYDMVNALNILGYKNARLKQNLTWSELRRLVDDGNDVVVTWLSDLPAGNVPLPVDGHYSVAKKLTRKSIVLFDPDVQQEITLPRIFFWSRFYDFELDHAGKRTDLLQSAVIARYPKKKQN